MVVLRRGAVASISSLISVVEGPVVIKDRHREVGREASPTRARTGGLCGEEVPELWQTLLAWLLARTYMGSSRPVAAGLGHGFLRALLAWLLGQLQFSTL